MELSELTAYASEKYQIMEQHKWADFPGFSVLCHPQTGKWIALLMRQWDTDTGVEIQRCDMKCGIASLARYGRSYLSPPIRMHGDKWIDIAFDERTEEEVVFRLLDQAVIEGNRHGYTVVLGARQETGEQRYQETALPFAGSPRRPAAEQIPERLRKMRHLYEYGRESAQARAKNFYRQAVFMRDYEDDYPWSGDFVCYFPTYHDLTTRQLRGYFTWRTRLRRGDYQPIAASAAYIYIYELLNGIGAASPEESLQKLLEFERGYLDAGLGDARMRSNLRRWALEYAVVHDLSPELAGQAADPAMMERDRAIAALQAPETHTDEEIFSALCRLTGKKTDSSPVLAAGPERGMRLFGEAWKAARAYRRQDKDLFTLCFGKKQLRLWNPLSNAVYYDETRPADRDYDLNECRRFLCRSGVWQTETYEKLSFDKGLLQGFLRETDARLRRYLKTGRYLKDDPANAWAIPYIDAVIEADRKAVLELARPRITIDLSGLDRIRQDARITRDSLLIDEEIGEEAFEGPVEETDEGSAEEISESFGEEAAEEVNGIPLDEVQIRILRALLEGRDVSGIIREHHLMPSIVADAINEALFDEIGDTVLLCEGDALALVEDYTEDITHLLGGTGNG